MAQMEVDPQMTQMAQIFADDGVSADGADDADFLGQKRKRVLYLTIDKYAECPLSGIFGD